MAWPVMSTVNVRSQSSAAWLECVLGNFDAFLCDHAACERKASAMALSLSLHYPDKPELVTRMIQLAQEELSHYAQVHRLTSARGLTLGADGKDPYIQAMRSHVQTGTEKYFLDRLLMAAVVEARGHERFATIGQAHQDPELARFYQQFAASEARHATLFVELAQLYFPAEQIHPRLEQWFNLEATIVEKLLPRPALH